MTLLQGCHILRADMTANGGTADVPTLRRLAASAPAPLAGDAAAAVPDVGKGTWPLDAAQFAHDCQPAGVRIPY